MGLDQDLERWVAADLIREDQAAAIVAHERRRSSAERRGVVAEAVGYVGAALAVGAVWLLVADLWADLVVAGQLSLIALLTVVAGGAGLVVARGAGAPARRLAAVLTTAAAVGAAWFAGLLVREVVEAGDGPVAISAGAAALVVAFVPLVRRPAVPLQLVVLAALQAVAAGLLMLPRITPDAVWFAVLAWAIALAWLLLGRGGLLRPGVVAVALGGVVALGALQVGSFDAPLVLLSLGVATSAGLVVLAVTGAGTAAMVVGGLGAFVFVPQLTFELFGDAIGAPATLLIVGLLLVLLAIGLGRARRELTDHGPPTAEGPS